jgi:electron-transferring-flavoprotein dehydrogenase
MRKFGMASEDPQVWALGVKEVWEVPEPLDKVIHTLGWPLRTAAKYKEFGGSWIYPMGERRVSIGFVVGLNYRDATLSPHDLLQKFKLHPLVKSILSGGKRIGWGAKTIPEGGYWAIGKLTAPGLAICGDSAGMVNVPELKGIHYAIHSGMFAAQAIIDALKLGSSDFSAYERAVRESVIGKDLYRTRNMKQPFEKGFFLGGGLTNLMVASKGRFPGGHWETSPDADESVFIGEGSRGYPKPDGRYTFDKLSSVYLSGNQTRDDAPNHIKIRQRVPRELAELWQNMCPAQVYLVPEDGEEGMVDLEITPSNCVQCGAITAKGGRLTPAEGGDGPNYQFT